MSGERWRIEPRTTPTAVLLSRATLDTIRADLAHVEHLVPIIAPFVVDNSVPDSELWAVDADGRVLYRQRWRDGVLIGAGQ